MGENDERLRVAFLRHKFNEGSESYFVRRCNSVTLLFFDFCDIIRKDLTGIRLNDARNFQRFLLIRDLDKGTVNGYISIVRVFYNYLVLVEVADSNPFRLLFSLHATPIDPPYVPMSQIKRIFQSLESGIFAPIHHIAIFECLYATGISGMELMYMRDSDFNREMELLVVRGTKRKQQREVPIPAQSVYVLKQYIIYRKLHFPMSTFLIVAKRGRMLYYKALHQAIKNLLASASVKQKGVSVMKNTYRRHLLASGVKIQTLGLLTGKRMMALIRHDEWKARLKFVHTMFHPRA